MRDLRNFASLAFTLCSLATSLMEKGLGSLPYPGSKLVLGGTEPPPRLPAMGHGGAETGTVRANAVSLLSWLFDVRMRMSSIEVSDYLPTCTQYN